MEEGKGHQRNFTENAKDILCESTAHLVKSNKP